MPDAARPVQMHPWELARLKQQEPIQADAPRPIMPFHRLTTCMSYQQLMSIFKSILFIICIHDQCTSTKPQGIQGNSLVSIKQKCPNQDSNLRPTLRLRALIYTDTKGLLYP